MSISARVIYGGSGFLFNAASHGPVRCLSPTLSRMGDGGRQRAQALRCPGAIPPLPAKLPQSVSPPPVMHIWNGDSVALKSRKGRVEQTRMSELNSNKPIPAPPGLG